MLGALHARPDPVSPWYLQCRQHMPTTQLCGVCLSSIGDARAHIHRVQGPLSLGVQHSVSFLLSACSCRQHKTTSMTCSSGARAACLSSFTRQLQHPSVLAAAVTTCCRWLGVSKFYIYDNNSTLPAMLMLWDYMQAGVVDYEYFLGGLQPPTLLLLQQLLSCVVWWVGDQPVRAAYAASLRPVWLVHYLVSDHIH